MKRIILITVTLFINIYYLQSQSLNFNNYPKRAVIGYNKDDSINRIETVTINDSSFITKAYRKDSSMIYWIHLKSINPEKRNGRYVSYYPNKKIHCNGQYIDNIAYGDWKYYKANGNLDTVINFNRAIRLFLTEVKEKIFLSMEMPASFEDGDCNNFQSYICRHAIFPDYALKRGIHGEAVVQFVVSDSGVVIMPKILTSIDKDINMELVRVMEAAPRWKPGKQSGRSVYEQFIIPIQFDINPESNDSIISHNNKSKPVEKDAIFHGGDINTFRTWVAEHVHFPESAIDMPLEGRIIVKFVVNPLGIVEDVKIIKGVDPDLDKEVEKTILSSPKWIPAKQGG